MDPAHALVVGASSDIGRAVAADLASLGLSLSLWGRDHDRLEATAAACGATGAGAWIDTVDVTDGAGLRRAVGGLSGRGRLTVVAYVAGVFDWAPAQRADPSVWERLIDVNLTAAATLTTLVLPALIQAAPSTLLFIGSGAAHQAYPGNAAYVASKPGWPGSPTRSSSTSVTTTSRSA